MVFVVTSHVTHDGKKYAPGSIIELSKEQAESMPWAVKPTDGKPDPKAEKERAAEAKTAAALEDRLSPGAAVIQKEREAAKK